MTWSPQSWGRLGDVWGFGDDVCASFEYADLPATGHAAPGPCLLSSAHRKLLTRHPTIPTRRFATLPPRHGAPVHFHDAEPPSGPSPEQGGTEGYFSIFLSG